MNSDLNDVESQQNPGNDHCQCKQLPCRKVPGYAGNRISANSNSTNRQDIEFSKESTHSNSEAVDYIGPHCVCDLFSQSTCKLTEESTVNLLSTGHSCLLLETNGNDTPARLSIIDCKPGGQIRTQGPRNIMGIKHLIPLELPSRT